MITIIWQYDVDPAHMAAFEAAYGPQGDWARLFSRSAGFLGLELLRGFGDSWLTIDRWRSEADFEAFIAAYRCDYDYLDRRTGAWTRAERRIGLFRCPDAPLRIAEPVAEQVRLENSAA